MKLSEAIRLGSTLVPLGYWYQTFKDGHCTDGCHIGRALLAVGIVGEPYMSRAREIWPIYSRKLSSSDLPPWIPPYQIENVLEGGIQSACNVAVLRCVPVDMVADWVATIELQEQAESVECATPILDAEQPSSLAEAPRQDNSASQPIKEPHHV